MKKQNVFLLTVVLTVLGTLVFSTPGFSQTPTPPGVEGLEQAANGEVEITWNPRTGTPSFIRGHIPLAAVGLTSGVSPATATFALVDRYADLFGIRQASQELKVVQTEVDTLGMRHVTLGQVYQGVEVYDAYMKVHLSADGQEVVAISSGFVPGIQLPDTQPHISADQALAVAQGTLPNGVLVSDSRLVVYPGLDEAPGASAKLAWLVELRDDSIPARNVYVVDAIDGIILDALDRLYDQSVTHGAMVSQEPVLTHAQEAWLTYRDEKQGFAVQYPSDWHLYLHAMPGRHRGFDPVLLTSFEVIFEEYGHELMIPPGEAALLISLEGNDLRSGQSLAEYAWENLASSEYHLTDNIQVLGVNTYVEMKGEIGTVWVTSQGSNVYSVFAFPQNDDAQTEIVQAILAKLIFLQDQPIYISEESTGRKAPGRYLPSVSGILQTVEIRIPAMRMPWDDRDARYHRYSAGPHGLPIGWSCTDLRDVSNMSALDFAMPTGTPVLAVAGGTAVRAEYVTGYGNVVGINHDRDFGSNFNTEYWHLDSITSSIHIGVLVGQGRVLGTSGSAGSGPHLHLDFRQWPSGTPYSAHGVLIDGYRAWTFVRQSDGKGYNYQGTLTLPYETTMRTNYSICSNVPITKWVSSVVTGTIEAGDGQRVSSSNLSCPVGQYRAEYYNNQTLSNSPASIRCERMPITYDWDGGGPGHGVGNDNFSVRWAGTFSFEDGDYTFTAWADDGIRVWVDDTLIINGWHDQPPTQYQVHHNLRRGIHGVLVEYYENGGGAVAFLQWQSGNTDPDDNRVISSGEILWGTTEPTSDVDTYYFNANQEQWATIRMTKSSFTPSLDPYLILYAPDGSEIAHDDDSGGDRNALISHVPLAQTGHFRIEAKSYAGSSTGLYSLRLTLQQPGQPNRETYDANHGYSLPGTLVRAEGDGPTGDQDVDHAHDFAGDVYDYYWNTHNRDSYDDQGVTLVSTANYGRSYMNAFWNGEQVTYGDEFPVKDVVAHEWTHAVTEHSADLEYRWQSGALNESFSDIFGAMVDRDDWLMGEDLPPHVLGGREAIRDLSDPPRFGQPEHTDDWVETCSDNEGVHTNNGITNKAYYNVATNAAVGKDRAERIFYRVLTVYLHPTSSLEDARSAALQATWDLSDTLGYTAVYTTVYTAVQDGFNAVGLNGLWNPPSNDCICAATTALSDGNVYPDQLSALDVAATLYRVRDQLLGTTTAGQYYRTLYELYTGRISQLLLLDPALRTTGGQILREVTPGLNQLMDGHGNRSSVTRAMVIDVVSFLQRLAEEDRASGGGELAQVIGQELDRIDWDYLIGMTFEEAWAYISSCIDARPYAIYLPLVSK